jgi:hypothetical protein
MAFPTIGSLSQNTHFSLLYHLYRFDTVDQRHLYTKCYMRIIYIHTNIMRNDVYVQHYKYNNTKKRIILSDKYNVDVLGITNERFLKIK